MNIRRKVYIIVSLSDDGDIIYVELDNSLTPSLVAQKWQIEQVMKSGKTISKMTLIEGQVVFVFDGASYIVKEAEIIG